ncbi:hypothetical protein QTP70_018384 [Hemibagrus guttatus]|uniref:Uncharacterized protein n=1 Tax=Hemibagrus guttatus TaxID=175788 RepID=A0AAE0UJC7_9TELE|nr:hypothetical protein QTP70_018384 [Hemibagrus guttatus]
MKKIFQQKEMFLQVSLADAQQKHQKALESISQLEEEKSELINLVNTLLSREQEQGEALCHSQLEIDELQKPKQEKLCSAEFCFRINECEQKQEAHSALLLEYEEIKKELTCTEEVLKVSLADAELKNQKALESVSQLEEKSELTNLLNTLRSNVEELGETFCNSDFEMDELQNECEQKQEAHSALLLENEEIKKELTCTEEVLKVSLADAELKNQKALESISQLEEEKSELTNLVNTLRSTVEELGETLCNCHSEMDELQNECEQKQEAHSALLLENEEIKKELTPTEEVLKVSLADAELKNQKALESVSQLEKEKSELMKRETKLRFTVQELGGQLCDCNLYIDKLKNVCEEQQLDYSILLSEYQQIKNFMKQ